MRTTTHVASSLSHVMCKTNQSDNEKLVPRCLFQLHITLHKYIIEKYSGVIEVPFCDHREDFYTLNANILGIFTVIELF